MKQTASKKSPFLISFGERLKFSRAEAGMSQEDLAKLLGTKKGSISRYERGDVSPGAEVLSMMCCHLNIDANWLLTGLHVDKAGDVPKPNYEKPSDTVPTIMEALAELGLSLDAKQLEAAMDFAFAFRADKKKIIDFMVWGHQVAGVSLKEK